MNQSFISAVKHSRVLAREQKQALLEAPEAFPAWYLEGLEQILTTYDENSKAREALLRKQLQAQLKQFERRLDEEGIQGNEKDMLLAKAHKQLEDFFPH